MTPFDNTCLVQPNSQKDHFYLGRTQQMTFTHSESMLTDNQIRLLSFVRKHKGWHNLVTPNETKEKEQVDQLCRLGLVELNETGMVRSIPK